MLLLTNTIVSGILFAIWKRSDPVNTILKIGMLVLFIANLTAYVKS